MFSLIAFVGIATFFGYKTGPGNRTETETASKGDVRFVLNWCELGDDRVEKVVHSHVSARSFTGDHLDAYAIKISHVEIAELTKVTDAFRNRWYRGDQLPQVLSDAVGFVGGSLHKVPWFPREEELRSSEFYVYPCSIYCQGVHPAATALIFIRPSDQMVFYFDAKT
jgi:hypothetical protein